MPRIATFMYCEESKQELVNGQPRISIINPLTVFRPAFVPGMFSFSIVIGILGIDITEKDYSLRIIFKNAKNLEAAALVDTGEIPLNQQDNPLLTVIPEEHRGMMANLDFRNVILKTEDEYLTEVFVDNELLGTFPIYVKGVEQT